MKILVTEPKRSKAEEMIHEVMEHPPETWLKYEHVKNGLFDIIEMEAKEYMEIRETGSHKEVLVALAHLAAAAKYALCKMTCP